MQQYSYPSRIKQLLAVTMEQRDIDWLQQTLQQALELELATIPLYTCALWSIDRDAENAGPARSRISRIFKSEMYHMGWVANMLAAVGGVPKMKDDAVPVFPSMGLPGGVLPTLSVELGSLSDTQLDLFMEIEKPEDALARADATYDSIGEFYDAIKTKFQELSDADISTARQLPDVVVMKDIKTISDYIDRIKQEGEGTDVSPNDPSGRRAHYYTFGEIRRRRRFAKNPTPPPVWDWTGDPVAFPNNIFVATRPATEQESAPLDRAYTGTLLALHEAWTNVDSSRFDDAVYDWMPELEEPAKTTMRDHGSWPLYRYDESLL